MSGSQTDSPLQNVLQLVEAAVTAGKLSRSAADHVKNWLNQPRYADYRPEVIRHVEEGQWKTLDDVFWTIIPFGTGGRRGRMYPIGSNAINDRTIGESAQGLADYVRSQVRSDHPLSCAIAYDTRHQSRHFAELCGRIMAASGFTVYFLDDYRSTPELSFLVRHQHCDCGMMVTASHNPPSDNAVKVYWSTGGQVLPPHDQGIIRSVMAVEDIRTVPFEEAVYSHQILLCTHETDVAYQQAVLSNRVEGPRELRILYSPLHGVGSASVVPILKADGFAQVTVYEPHAAPDGDFPNVPNHVANPENAAVFDAMIQWAQQHGADLILATDPDCDRLGCAAPLTTDPRGPWKPLSGNQIGALLTDFLLEHRRQQRTVSPDHFVVKTLVTTELIRRLADAYGVRTIGNLQVGFKWIAQAIDQFGPELFVFGTEESHGYLVGQYARDKDGAVAAMLLSEQAASLRRQGKSLHQRLQELYRRFGYHLERQQSIQMEGSQGMQRMAALMARLRDRPPASLGGMPVMAVCDYDQLTRKQRDGTCEPLQAQRGNMIVFELDEQGNAVAIRPSGTEPKVKMYFFAYAPPEQSTDLAATQAQLASRIHNWLDTLQQIVQEIP